MSSVAASAMLRFLPATMRGIILKIARIGGEGILARAAFGREHVEEQRDQAGIGIFLRGGPSGWRRRGSFRLLVEAVLRDRHGDFAGLRLAHGRKGDDPGIDQAADNPDNNEELKQGRHVETCRRFCARRCPKNLIAKFTMPDAALHNKMPALPQDCALVAALGHRSVVLVGMMGAGKSSVGRKLGTRLGLPFVDADTKIEEAAGMSIPDIFETRGEAEFRSGEARVIARLLDGGPQVLATGGGVRGASLNGYRAHSGGPSPSQPKARP